MLNNQEHMTPCAKLSDLPDIKLKIAIQVSKTYIPPVHYGHIVSKGAMNSFNELFPLARMFPLAAMHIPSFVFYQRPLRLLKTNLWPPSESHV